MGQIRVRGCWLYNQYLKTKEALEVCCFRSCVPAHISASPLSLAGSESPLFVGLQSRGWVQ